MKEFTYVITDPVGIHARPAGLLVKEAKNFKSTATFIKGEKSAKATALMNSWEWESSRETKFLSALRVKTKKPAPPLWKNS